MRGKPSTNANLVVPKIAPSPPPSPPMGARGWNMARYFRSHSWTFHDAGVPAPPGPTFTRRLLIIVGEAL